ncbi:MAG: hypothetical protein Q7T70_00305 [Polaromonas sp.]|nr:hypothetical protein [Polaromonas sp.]
MADFALVLAQHTAMLYQLGRGGAERMATAEMQDDPAAWVAQHLPEHAQCSLVSDIMDEAYIRNVLPPMWVSATRQQLLERRMAQQLRDNPYRAAVLAPSGSFRPPTRVSLIGMGQTERIAQWLEALKVHGTRVKGLLPLSALIAMDVDMKAPRRARAEPFQEPAGVRPVLSLVATPAGLRQVLVRGKVPMFSRLALGTGEGSLSAEFVLAEARRTVQYLVSQEWLTAADQPVATQLWLPSGHEPELAEVANDPALDVQFIKAVPDAYVHLLARLKSAPSHLQFLPAESRTEWRAAQLGKTARLAGLSAMALAALWSADLLWESWGKRSLAQEQLARAATINRQASQEVLRAKGDLTQAGLAVATVLAWQQTMETQPPQLAGLQHLSQALKGAEGVEIQKITWELPRMQVQAAGAPPQPGPPLECPKPEAAPAAATAPAPAPEPPKSSLALMGVNATLPRSLSQRQAIDLQGSLMAGLSKDGWTAVLLKSTVALDPVQVQTGTLGEVRTRTLELCVQKAAA